MEIIIMYRTALAAQTKLDTTNSSIYKSICCDLIDDFNRGKHRIDKLNEINSYSVLTT